MAAPTRSPPTTPVVPLPRLESTWHLLGPARAPASLSAASRPPPAGWKPALRGGRSRSRAASAPQPAGWKPALRGGRSRSRAASAPQPAGWKPALRGGRHHPRHPERAQRAEGSPSRTAPRSPPTLPLPLTLAVPLPLSLTLPPVPAAVPATVPPLTLPLTLPLALTLSSLPRPLPPHRTSRAAEPPLATAAGRRGAPPRASDENRNASRASCYTPTPGGWLASAEVRQPQTTARTPHPPPQR